MFAKIRGFRCADLRQRWPAGLRLGLERSLPHEGPAASQHDLRPAQAPCARPVSENAPWKNRAHSYDHLPPRANCRCSTLPPAVSARRKSPGGWRSRPKTVDRHVENIRLKLRARNRAHMIQLAFRFGLKITSTFLSSLLVETTPLARFIAGAAAAAAE